jgi:hypothetical protein
LIKNIKKALKLSIKVFKLIKIFITLSSKWGDWLSVLQQGRKLKSFRQFDASPRQVIHSIKTPFLPFACINSIEILGAVLEEAYLKKGRHFFSRSPPYFVKCCDWRIYKIIYIKDSFFLIFKCDQIERGERGETDSERRDVKRTPSKQAVKWLHPSPF